MTKVKGFDQVRDFVKQKAKDDDSDDNDAFFSVKKVYRMYI